MRSKEPYGEPRKRGAETGPGIEEEAMNSHLLQGIAVERARDMRNEAMATSAASAARSARPSRRTAAVVPGRFGRLAHRTVHP